MEDRNFSYKLYGNGRLDIKLDAKIVGRIRVLDIGEPSAYISHLSIEEGYRNSGIGSVLLEKVLSKRKQDGSIAVSLHVSVTNTGAIRFYKRFGFFIACTTTDKKDKHFLMVKKLSV